MKMLEATIVSPAVATVHTNSTSPVTQEAKTMPDTFESLMSPTLTQHVSQLLDAKDRRAYEVARQRAKHPTDRCKARNQKSKHGWSVGLGVTRARGAQPVLVVEDSVFADVKEESEQKKNCDVERKAEKSEVVVHLEDLIRVVKVRKAKAGDFEVIPHVRAVIALDDADFSDDRTGGPMTISDFDADDWEHIESSGTDSSDEDEISKAPSYAQVVSSTRQ